MDRNALADSSTVSSIPHTRGDGPPLARLLISLSQYSPHAWGWTVRASFVAKFLSVFPTRVGMDRSLQNLELFWECIPHTRGDGPAIRLTLIVDAQYSPHAWGWTANQLIMNHNDPVFPTRVGMDRFSLTRLIRRCGIPHTRGDGPMRRTGIRRASKYSPHAWGWTV